jgi:hypothetical protein
VLEHLHTVYEGGPPADCRDDVYGLGHLLEVGAVLQALLAVGVDAVRALDGVGDGERDERFFTSRERAVGKDRPVPGEENLSARSLFPSAIDAKWARCCIL